VTLKKIKIIADSIILSRQFHCDGFIVGKKPQFLSIFLGGSGMDQAEYESRLNSMPKLFDDSFISLESEGLSFSFVFITAPFDIPFGKFSEFPDEKFRWNKHLKTELLSIIEKKLELHNNLPIYFMAYSGGTTLILSGIQLINRCFGTGVLGGDGINTQMVSGSNWKEPITLYYNRQDPIFPYNKATIKKLYQDEDLIYYCNLHGSHSLKDYIKNESFSGLIRRADRILKITE